MQGCIKFRDIIIVWLSCITIDLIAKLCTVAHLNSTELVHLPEFSEYVSSLFLERLISCAFW